MRNNLLRRYGCCAVVVLEIYGSHFYLCGTPCEEVWFRIPYSGDRVADGPAPCTLTMEGATTIKKKQNKTKNPEKNPLAQRQVLRTAIHVYVPDSSIKTCPLCETLETFIAPTDLGASIRTAWSSYRFL